MPERPDLTPERKAELRRRADRAGPSYEAIRELLAENDALLAEVERLRSGAVTVMCNHAPDVMSYLRNEILALRAEIERLRALGGGE